MKPCMIVKTNKSYALLHPPGSLHTKCAWVSHNIMSHHCPCLRFDNFQLDKLKVGGSLNTYTTTTALYIAVTTAFNIFCLFIWSSLKMLFLLFGATIRQAQAQKQRHCEVLFYFFWFLVTFVSFCRTTLRRWFTCDHLGGKLLPCAHMLAVLSFH